MSDRFDFIEFGDHPAVSPSPEATDAPVSRWKPTRLRAVELIGGPGSGAGEFNGPVGLAVDRWGSLYVADSSNHRVQRITSGGDVYVYGRAGSAPGQLWGPVAVAVDPGGEYFWVAEQGNNRLQCFLFTGQSQICYPGFTGPSGVAFDPSGMLWIANTGAGRLERVNTKTGERLPGLDATAGLVRPLSVACGAERLTVTDAGTGSVLCFGYDGTPRGGLGEGRRLSQPAHAAFDAEGRCYLAEPGANRLHVFDSEQNSYYLFDNPGSKLGPLSGPAGVAIGPGGEIYLADTQNHRVLRLAWD